MRQMARCPERATTSKAMEDVRDKSVSKRTPESNASGKLPYGWQCAGNCPRLARFALGWVTVREDFGAAQAALRVPRSLLCNASNGRGGLHVRTLCLEMPAACAAAWWCSGVASGHAPPWRSWTTMRAKTMPWCSGFRKTIVYTSRFVRVILAQGPC